MLDYIRGQVVSKSPTKLVIDAAGIGYLLHIPLSTSEKIPHHGEITILTQLFLWEDVIKIFGFATYEEREMFRLLISVNGIGPNMAIMILSGSTVEDIKYAIAGEDTNTLAKIKGIGKKTAERIILELKESVTTVKTYQNIETEETQDSIVSDAKMALISLGYGRSEAEKTINAVVKKLQKIDNTEILVREALKHKT